MTSHNPEVALSPTEEPMPPHGQGRYQIIAQIATSAFGPLCIARSSGGPEDSRIVALRRIGKQPPLEAALLGRLAMAAVTAKDVRDPLVAAVLDVVVTDLEMGVVTEYVEGELLRSVQRRAGLGNQPLSMSVALKLAIDMAAAVRAASDGWLSTAGFDPLLRSAAHGGLSPDSVLVASYGDPVLLDIGIAGLLLARPDLTMHPEIAPYRAPEQLSSGAFDERADVFVLGTILWELLTNRPLFGSSRWARTSGRSEAPPAGEDALRARHRVLEMPIPRLDAVVRAGAAVPKDLASIVGRALSRSPSDRQASVGELRDELLALGEGRIATSEEVAKAVNTIAGGSLEARRVALAAVTGRPGAAPAEGRDSARPTAPPQPTSDASISELEELVSSPGALRSLGAAAERPPPLPRRKGP